MNLFKKLGVILVALAALCACTNKEQTYYTDKMNAINPDAPVKLIDILIDKKRFRFSSKYTHLVGAWDPEKQAFIGYFTYNFDIDTFLPLTPKSREEVWGNLTSRTFKILGGEEELAARLSDDPKLSYLHMVRAPGRDKFGLTAYLTGDKQYPDEILVGKLESGEVYLLDCYSEELFPAPNCTNTVAYKGLQLETRYKKTYLAQWRELNQKTLSKLSSFIVSE